MAKPLKVFGGTRSGTYVPKSISSHRQTRHVVATTSMTAACRLLGLGRDYVAETGNDAEVKAAMSQPGTVFWCNGRWNGPYLPVPPPEQEKEDW